MQNKIVPILDTRKKLIQDIESAFGEVTLGDGIGIFQAEALDNYATPEEIKSERVKDRESWTKWQDIPDHIISGYNSVLCFTDPRGMKFLLPAYMRFSLRNYDTGGSVSVDSTIYALDRGIEIFGGDPDFPSPDQKRVIIVFLKFMILEAGDRYIDSVAASGAYERHWSKFEQSET